MTNKHQEFMTQLIKAVFQSKGVTDRSLRISIESAVAPGGDQLDTNDSPIPEALRPYLNKVSRFAYKVTDHDIESLKAQGYSEEAIFELTVSAAVGAGLGRLNQGLAALNGGQATLNGGG
ncbi:MAG: hypothetical protein GWP61_19915 [Chloroflexi bacterium]|jgi:hypothetical protein|nr:hypothetical protein [Chloroflexota bacterium]